MSTFSVTGSATGSVREATNNELRARVMHLVGELRRQAAEHTGESTVNLSPIEDQIEYLLRALCRQEDTTGALLWSAAVPCEPLHLRLVGWFQEYVVMTTGVLVVGPVVGLLKWLRRLLLTASGVVLVFFEPLHAAGQIALRWCKWFWLQALVWAFERYYRRLFKALSEFDRGAQ